MKKRRTRGVQSFTAFLYGHGNEEQRALKHQMTSCCAAKGAMLVCERAICILSLLNLIFSHLRHCSPLMSRDFLSNLLRWRGMAGLGDAKVTGVG